MHFSRIAPMRSFRAITASVLTASLAAALPLAAQQFVRSAASEVALVRVAARALPRGTVLAERDIALVPAASLTAPASDSLVRAGWVTRRLVRAGEVLRAPAVAPAPLFSANHAVRFLVRRSGFQMSFDGTAVVAASLGDTIPVRLGAKRRLMGVVSGHDEVVALDSLRNP